jgi:hypothetical protein
VLRVLRVSLLYLRTIFTTNSIRSRIFIHSNTTISGIEVAGLAVDVRSILVEVVKSYSTVREKVHTFRHCGENLGEQKMANESVRITNVLT